MATITCPAALLSPAEEVLGSLRRDRPFTPVMARQAGVSRRTLERLVGQGTVRQLLRGVYADARAPDTPALRARSVALVSHGALAVGRTAAWVHGADVPRGSAHVLPPVDLATSRRVDLRRYRADDVCLIGRQPVTTPVRTVVDLAGSVRLDHAVGAADALMRAGLLRHRELVEAALVHRPSPGSGRLALIASVADGRAEGFEESALRLWWWRCEMPTPVPDAVVHGVRIALTVPVHAFGVVIDDPWSADQWAVLERAGWEVVGVPGDLIRAGEAQRVQEQLVRLFRTRLRAEVA